MKVNQNKLLATLENVKMSKLASYLGMTRPNLYYHFYNLKNGHLTFKIDVIKKISKFVVGDDDIFFEK